jgi:hypothetical protein
MLTTRAFVGKHDSGAGSAATAAAAPKTIKFKNENPFQDAVPHGQSLYSSVSFLRVVIKPGFQYFASQFVLAVS